MRSVLVVFTLLTIALSPAAAGPKNKTGKQKKAAALKKAGGKQSKKVVPTGETSEHQGPGTIGYGRQRAQRRTATTTTLHQHERTAVPTAMTAAREFDSSAPRKRGGRVKRWVAGIFLVAALAAGGYGWHAADMNSKVSHAWSQIEHVISDVTHPHGGGGGGGGGGGHTTPIPPVPDPGPEIPDGPPSDPGPSIPGPSGGQGHQTPHGHETDHPGG